MKKIYELYKVLVVMFVGLMAFDASADNMTDLQRKAKAGNIDAMIELASKYAEGGHRDYDKMLEWAYKAYNMNCTQEQKLSAAAMVASSWEWSSAMADIISREDPWFDTRVFMTLYQRAKDGHTRGKYDNYKANCYLALCYEDGIGVAVNEMLSEMWCKRVPQTSIFYDVAQSILDELEMKYDEI